MKSHRCIIIAALCLFISGCVASGPKGLKELEPRSGKGILYVFRESKIAASGINTTIELDGKELGTLPNGSFLVTYVTPGTHKVSARFSIINKMYYRDCDILIPVSSGETKAVQMSFEMTSLSVGGAGSNSTWENGLVEVPFEKEKEAISQLRINNSDFEH
jgi:hypothetical protein